MQELGLRAAIVPKRSCLQGDAWLHKRATTTAEATTGASLLGPTAGGVWNVENG